MLVNPKTIFKSITDELNTIYQEDEAKAMAYLLLEDLLKISKTDVIMEAEVSITETLNSRLLNAIERLKRQEPIQHILGKTYFYGHTFLVNGDVLIPRQETEELVDWLIKSNHQPGKILDIGTGSGCIAISLALEYPKSEVSAIDISESALHIAKENATANHVHISFQRADVLKDLPEGYFDVVISNPPYVRHSERKEMEKNVLDFEPGNALFVADQEPLVFYDRIIKISTKILHPKGWLYFEINEAYAKEVVQLMEAQQFTEIQVKKDLNRKDRMIRGLVPIYLDK